MSSPFVGPTVEKSETFEMWYSHMDLVEWDHAELTEGTRDICTDIYEQPVSDTAAASNRN